MATKMTYSRAIEVALSYVPENDAEARDKLIALKASLDKKNSAERKPTATQKQNEELRAVILGHMTSNPNQLFLVSDLIHAIPELNGMSPQKVGPLVRQLEAENAVEKVVDKRRTYYKVA